MEKILILGDGSLIKGILILPFVINGFILLIKGALANMVKLDETRTVKKEWQASAYFAVFIFSYLALMYAVAKLL